MGQLFRPRPRDYRNRLGLRKPIMGIHRPGNPSVDHRLDAGVQVTFLGNSILEYNNTASTGVSNLSLSANAQGELQQVLSMFPAFNLDSWVAADTYDVPYGREFYGANQGYAGQTSTTIASRRANALSQGSGLYVLAMCTNDGLENGAAVTQGLANIQSLCTDIMAAGARALIIGVRPTGAAQNTAQRISGRKNLNSQLASYVAGYPNQLYFIDLWNKYDPNADDIVDVDYMADALHPTPKGAHNATIGVGGLLEKFQQIVKPGDIFALNQNAELCTAFPFAGSGGTSGHANITGTIPTGWTVEFQAGNTALVVCSVVNGDLVLDITPGASSTTIRVRHSNVAAVSGTDWMKLMADVETTGGNIRARLEDNLNVTNYFANGLIVDPAVQANRAKSITPAWNARSTVVRPCVFITAPASAAAFQAKVHSVTCKKQTSPKTSRNAGSVPTNTTPISITGTGTVGQTLTAVPGIYDQNSQSVAQTRAYRWYRNGVFRGTSTGVGSTYITVAGDSGSTITCGESAANAAGRSSETISNGIAVT